MNVCYNGSELIIADWNTGEENYKACNGNGRFLAVRTALLK